MKINEQEKEAVIGLHAVTGNDKKIRKQGKRKFWKKNIPKIFFVKPVRCSGDSWDVRIHLRYL